MSQMVKVAVAGVGGRMGARLVHHVCRNPRTVLAGAFEYAGHPGVGKSLGEVCGLADSPALFVAGDPVEAMAESDVLIDFTVPEATLKNLDLAATSGKATVIGTTGITAEQKEIVAKLAREAPVVMAPNMSVGMNLMFKLAGEIAAVLGDDYALEVLEAHHDQKKDAPSGSAVRLIESLAQARGWDPEKASVHGRKGIVGARTKEEIGVSVIRGGDVVGDHTIFYLGQGDRLELTHRAHSRDTFASGAVRAAIWVAGREPGLYDMQDVLGLKGQGA